MFGESVMINPTGFPPCSPRLRFLTVGQANLFAVVVSDHESRGRLVVDYSEVLQLA